ncbi:hypothetical protein ASPSYDRAFT_39431 [Aspergillus sydowii CBS 593.65]|uniref:Uncharacterized protein n=1 Tax=Aspergillus sydowii CBS 593.65 TaxID=1036612 RepID=A0A1L9TZ14_9EURO|nr:uncharacterized protein ASPSYDRAFT_39431 [Aspergillus sydowii CBS 593.65]OJJ64680.1 hypothetical protein ASPSYDRAFT_39431 [Aspergillus sydowii CBS 593.65]
MPPGSLNLGTRSSTARSSRNTAFLSIFGVIAGGYALFRYQSPRHGVVEQEDVERVGGETKIGRSKVVSQEDVNVMMGDSPTGKGHVARSPRKASNREDF